MNSCSNDYYMELAILEAEKALQEEEVPIGAVLVKDLSVIARGHNRCIKKCDPTAHAEINTLRLAGRKTGNYRLPGTILYVTVEPCIMCMGAILNARIEKLVFGAPDPRAGACGTVYDFSDEKK